MVVLFGLALRLRAFEAEAQRTALRLTLQLDTACMADGGHSTCCSEQAATHMQSAADTPPGKWPLQCCACCGSRWAQHPCVCPRKLP